VAQFLGLPLSEYWTLINTPSSNHLPIDELHDSPGGHSATLDLASNPGDLAETGEVIDLVSEAVNNMDEKSKTILVLYYLHGRTLGEIGKILGVTESRVCQLQSKALQSLSHILGQGGMAVA
jgi:RNA polymerase sigma factor for flagellar operon FliA